MKFYTCAHCGNVIKFIKDVGVPILCCGQKMVELVPSSTDAAVEKHIPVVSKEGNIVTVTVGEVIHPMSEAHYIEWILLETKKLKQKIELKPTDEPVAKFILADDDEVISAYAYCNLHSLWKTK